MLAEDFPEVEPVNRVGEGHGKEPRASEQRPCNELPVIDPRPVLYAQDDDSFERRVNIAEIMPY